MELYSNEDNEIGTYWLDLMMDKKQVLNGSEKLVRKTARPPNRQGRQKPVPPTSDKSFLKTYRERRSALVALADK